MRQSERGRGGKRQKEERHTRTERTKKKDIKRGTVREK